MDSTISAPSPDTKRRSSARAYRGAWSRRGIPWTFRTALLLAPAETTLKHALSAAGAEPVELPVGDSGILRDVTDRAT
jgi:hypothetical protein